METEGIFIRGATNRVNSAVVESSALFVTPPTPFLSSIRADWGPVDRPIDPGGQGQVRAVKKEMARVTTEEEEEEEEVGGWRRGSEMSDYKEEDEVE